MLKRFRDLFGEMLAQYKCKLLTIAFQFQYTFIWGEAHPFALFGQLGKGGLGDGLCFFLLSTVLSPSSGPCIPGIFGESRSWPEATLLSIFSALQSSFQGSLFPLSILCAPLLGKYQMLPDTTLAVDSMPWPMAPVQAGWKLPATSSREGTCETVKGCVNHAPVLGGVSPNTSSTYKEKKEETVNHHCLQECAVKQASTAAS